MASLGLDLVVEVDVDQLADAIRPLVLV